MLLPNQIELAIPKLMNNKSALTYVTDMQEHGDHFMLHIAWLLEQLSSPAKVLVFEYTSEDSPPVASIVFDTVEDYYMSIADSDWITDNLPEDHPYFHWKSETTLNEVIKSNEDNL